MAQTNGEIRSEIAELTEKLKQIRVEKGLPPEPKPRPMVVSAPLAYALVERLQPLKKIAVRYAGLLAQDQLVPLDTEKLDKYVVYARLLGCQRDSLTSMIGFGAHGSISIIDGITQAICEGREAEINVMDRLRRLSWAIDLMSRKNYHIGGYDYFRETGRSAKEDAAIYDDEATFQAAIAEALAQIEEDEQYE